MSYDQIITTVFVIVISAILIYVAGYVSGRLYGFRQGMEQAKKLSGQMHHLQGMTDGYVMALQHTPAQRDEYMNNVLLKIGATTPADIEAQRQRRFRIQMEDAGNLNTFR